MPPDQNVSPVSPSPEETELKIVGAIYVDGKWHLLLHNSVSDYFSKGPEVPTDNAFDVQGQTFIFHSWGEMERLRPNEHTVFTAENGGGFTVEISPYTNKPFVRSRDNIPLH